MYQNSKQPLLYNQLNDDGLIGYFFPEHKAPVINKF